MEQRHSILTSNHLRKEEGAAMLDVLVNELGEYLTVEQGWLEKKKTASLKTLHSTGHPVELVASARAGLAGLAGFHTSILIGGEEYYFSPSGIRTAAKLSSHRPAWKASRSFVGISKRTGQELLDFLAEHFRAGSYDFLRKNCNSFTDCVLYFLCEERLHFRYRSMDTIGRWADGQTGILQSISKGGYRPNPSADDFDLEDLLEEIDDARAECSDTDED
eukprot:TRINITY_DN28241_c0_g1_i1.p1 TRINITY_DN28241_c0_g1~~TRINITY_DN28241_c0_g1_i1.p1  ORF type:complete len:239 (-),score=33.34 TRINITY_DN28241_c0_g1_i1:116-772(-)